MQILTHLGEPSTVSSKADQWSSKVGSPVSARVALADIGSLAVDDNWKGTAAIITALGATATIFGIPAGILIAIAAAAGFGAAFWGAGENLKSQCRSAKPCSSRDVGEHRVPERSLTGGDAVTSPDAGHPDVGRAVTASGTAQSLVAGAFVLGVILARHVSRVG